MAVRHRPPAPCRVLVVDDNQDAARTLALLLEESGHEVHVAQDGHGAVACALQVRPEYVFLDLSLPGLDGFAVARRLRGEASLAGMKIIAISAHSSEEYRRRCTEDGFDHYLVKPVDPRFVESLLGARPGTGFA